MDCWTKLWKVQYGDWLRGLLVAVLTTPITIILESVNKGSLVINWKTVLAAAVAGGLGYILKNLLTGEQGKLLTNK